MALISIKRNIDLQPGLNAPAVFNCSQSDKGTTIMLGLMNGGNDYTVPSGVTITIRGSRSNGAVFTPVSATSSGSTVSFALTEEMTDTAGPTLCEAVLEQGNNVLGTANFIINVEASPMGADVPPVFTDAAWTWMLGKLTTETVPALGDDVISSIQGKVDKSQGSTNAKKFLRVNTSGNVSLASTDKTLLVADQIADAKETGDQIRALDAEIDGVATTLGGSISTLNGITTDLQSSKLNKNQGTSNAGKTMVVDSSGNIVPGDALALKANESTIAPEFDSSTSYTAGQYVYKNGVLYRFTAAHSGAWTGTDTVVVTVGGEVEELNSSTAQNINKIYNDFYDANQGEPVWEQGSYSSTGRTPSDIRIRLNGIISSKKRYKVVLANGYKARVAYYTGTGFSTLDHWGEWKTGTFYICDDAYNWAMIMGKADDSNIVPADGANCTFTRYDAKEYALESDVIAWIRIHQNYETNSYWNIEGIKAVRTTLSGHFVSFDPIIVKPGQIFSVQGRQGNTDKARIWTVTDEEMNILTMAGNHKSSGSTNYVEELIVPENGYYLLACSYYSGPCIINRRYTAIEYATKQLLENKVVAVIGDSISTNGNTGTDANVPEITITAEDVGVELSAYLTYYDVQAGLSLGGHTYVSSEIGNEVTFTPVAEDIGKSIGLPNNYNANTLTTWWEVAQSELGFKTIPVCWSGSSITSHEANSENYAICAHAWHPSQIRKCGIRIPGSMARTAPDVIIIYRGTNDFSHEPYTLLTEDYFDGYNWSYPVDDAVSGGYGYLEGLALTIKELRNAYPSSQIYLCTLNVFKRVNYAHFPTNNGINSLPEYNNAIRKAADFFGCGLIEFDKDGITFENCYSGGYITDSSDNPTHPTEKGHYLMGQKAITDIKAQYNPMK